MSLLQTVRSRLSPLEDTQPDAVNSAPTDEELELQLQVELRGAITALLQAKSPAEQASIYRQVAEELKVAGTAYDSLQRALRAIYPDNQADAQIITENLAANGYGKQPLADRSVAEVSDFTGVIASTQPSPSPPRQDSSVSRRPIQAVGQNLSQSAAPVISRPEPRPARSPVTATLNGKIDYYDGSLLSETIASGAFSSVIVGAHKTGASTVLRAFIWSMLYEPVGQRPAINITDTRGEHLQGLETIGGLVAYVPVIDRDAIDAIASRIEKAHNELTNRQRDYLAKGKHASLYEWKPYLFAVDGWGEVMDYLAKCSTKQLEEDAILKPMFTHLRRLLSLGPDVGMTTILTARSYDRVLPDSRSLGETRLLVLGRPTPDFGGGFDAVDRLMGDKHQLPGNNDRVRMSALLAHAKRVGQPVILAIAGGARMAKMPDLSEHNQHDFAQAYRAFDTF
ncbi:MAG: hypothetical protein WA885_04825 [Phormidesmis sp.]